MKYQKTQNLKVNSLLATGLMWLTSPAVLPAAEVPKTFANPNVVYLLADDLGWSDLSVHRGGTIPTPNIDRLFKQGIELGHFMGWCVCSPTRAMLMTSRHPFRVGTGPETGGELAKEETTIAEGFKANGYRTGIFGKWHNGENPDTPEYRQAFEEAWKSSSNKKLKGGLGVNAHGFDEAWVYYDGGADYFTRRTVQGRGPVSWWHNLEYRPQDAGYTDDLITDHALEFIRNNKDHPFFCYVPFHIVHGPLQAKDTDLASVDAKVTDKTKRTYSAMVQAMDKNVASILAELDKLGLRENTIVVFTSDNGATRDGSNLPLRGGKHTMFEGGTHLPTVIHWPNGKVVNGKWDGLCGSLDMFPTLMAMANLEMPKTRPLDGKNIWPAFRDNTKSPVESYYWSWHNEDAIRTADYRMHRFCDHVELYDIRTDISETTNVADAHPDVVTSLTTMMNKWVQSIGVALTHQAPPVSLDAKPAPAGEVLEISVTVTDKAKLKDILIVPFAQWGGNVFATDYIEYDLAVAPGSPLKGFYYTPFKGNDSKQITLYFKRGEGLDQFGREQFSGPEPKGGAGIWEHRIIGLSSYGPGILPGHSIVFNCGKPGNYKLYVDNLRIRHYDGSTSSIWKSGEDTKAKKIADTESFKGVQMRAVPSSAITAK